MRGVWEGAPLCYSIGSRNRSRDRGFASKARFLAHAAPGSGIGLHRKWVKGLRPGRRQSPGAEGKEEADALAPDLSGCLLAAQLDNDAAQLHQAVQSGEPVLALPGQAT